MDGYDRTFVVDNTIQNNLYYDNNLVVKYTLKYPQFFSFQYLEFLIYLNSYYYEKIVSYEQYIKNEFYQNASKDYEYSVKNNFPIRSYEAYTDYKITLNEACIISLYSDQYEYTGGAHGNTIRTSESWDLSRNRRIFLKDIFPMEDYKTYILDLIVEQIEKQNAEGNSIYFDNYTELVYQYFREENFYLTRAGVVIYFQQYEIGPYASGILTFFIPYSEQITPPTCLE